MNVRLMPAVRSFLSCRCIRHHVLTMSLPQSHGQSEERTYTYFTGRKEHLLAGISTTPAITQQRFKKKASSRDKEQEAGSDDEDEDDEKQEDDIVGTGYTDQTISCNSLRIDAVAKGATNLPRNQIEEAFMEGRLRLNGYRITKKSEWVSETDELDLIKGRNRENGDNIDVSRVQIRSIPDVSITSTTAKIKVKVRKFKFLTIPNYIEEPWQGSTLTEEK